MAARIRIKKLETIERRPVTDPRPPVEYELSAGNPQDCELKFKLTRDEVKALRNDICEELEK